MNKKKRQIWAIALIICMITTLLPLNSITVYASTDTLYVEHDVSYYALTGSEAIFNDGVDYLASGESVLPVGYLIDQGGEPFKAALKFNLSAYSEKTITGATLRLYIADKRGGPAIKVYSSNDGAWVEGNDLTNYPIRQDTLLYSKSEADNVVTSNNWLEIDLNTVDGLSYLNSAKNSGSASFIIDGSTSGDNIFGILCKEDGSMGSSYKAQLIITATSATPLDKVTGVALSDTGVATWTNASHATNYEAQLYKDGNIQGIAVTETDGTTGHNFLSAMRTAGSGTYTVTVTAKGDGTTYSNGAVSDAITGQIVTKLSTVSTGLTWSDNVAHWTGVSNAVSYDVQLYKDASAVGAAQNVLTAYVASGAGFGNLITTNGGGTYTYKVTPIGDNKLVLDGDQSGDSDNNIKAIQLSQVEGVALSASGVATWTNVSHATNYEVQLYKDGSIQGIAVTETDGVAGHDFLSDMRSAGAGAYTVKVTAKGNGTTYSNGIQSNASLPQTMIQLATVSSGLNWAGDVAHWDTVANAVSYDVELYKAGSLVAGSAKNILAASAGSGANFTSEIALAGYGSFTYKVTAKGNSTLILDASQSDASDINLKATPLAQVLNPVLSSTGVASWDAVTNASTYTVKLYKNGSDTGDSLSTASTSLNILTNMRTHGVGTYTITVTAMGDGVNFSNGVESLASSTQVIAKLSTAGSLSWSSDEAHWSAVTNAVSYDVQLYKNGSAVSGAFENVLEANRATGVDFSSEIFIEGGGTYTFKVTAKGDGILFLDADQSDASTDNIEAIQLAQVTNVTLSSTGVASWDDVSNESNYSVQLYKDGSALGSAVLKNADELSYNFLSAMRAEGEGIYTVKVTAIGDGTYYTDGVQSVALSSRTISKLTTATSLTWTGNIAHFLAVTDASSYEVQLYKGGSIVTGAVKTVTAGALSAGADFATEIASEGAGTYTFKATAMGDGVLILDGEQSLPSSANIVATSLAQVTGVALSSAGVASWDNVSNETNYSVQLFKNGSTFGSAVLKNADELSHDFLSVMRSTGAGTYTVKVTAVGDTVNYSNGLESVASSGQTVIKLATVSGLLWASDTAKFTEVANAVNYEVQLYKNGSTLGLVKTITATDASLGADFSTEIAAAGVGSYSFKVTAKGDANLILDAETSSVSTTNLKTIQLAQVTGVTLSSTGVASWTDVNDEIAYEVQLYKDGTANGSVIQANANVVSHDFLTQMRDAGAGIYTIKVVAKGDGIYYLDGLQSAASSGETVIKLATVSGLLWASDTAKFTEVANAVNYEVQLYKNGSTLGSVKSITAANASLGADFSSEIAAAGVGSYSFKVTAKGDANLILDAETSSVSTTNLKIIQLAQVTGVTLSDAGVASWTDVASENNYEIQLYKDGIAYGSPTQVNANVVSKDFLATIREAGAGAYTVKVTAKGENAYYVDGEASSASATQTITKLTTVTSGLTWSNTLAKWSPVTNVVTYEVQLYKNGIASGTPVTVLASNADGGVDFNSAMLLSGFGTYSYKVTAKGNTTFILDAEQSLFSNDYTKKTEQSNATFDKNDDSKNNKKISVELLLNPSLLTSIKKGTNKLKVKEDYKVTNNVVTISKDYLETLGVGSSTLTILYNNGDKQTIVIKVVDTTEDSSSESTSDTTSDSTTTTGTSTTGTNTTQTPATASTTSTANANEENSTENASNENLEDAENGANNPENEQQASDESTNQQGSGSFEVETETAENTPTFTMPSEEELYDAVLTEEDKAAMAAGEKVTIKVEVEAIEEPEDGDVVRENLGENTFGMFLDISIIKTIGTQQSEVHDLNQPITLTFDIPEELRGLGKYFVVRVHNGEYVVLEDEDDDPNTVTFTTDQFSTYALVYDEAAAGTSSVVFNAADKKDNLIIIVFIILAIISVGIVVVVLKTKRKEVK